MVLTKDSGLICIKYHTRLCRQSSNVTSNPESSSVAFDRGGTQFPFKGHMQTINDLRNQISCYFSRASLPGLQSDTLLYDLS